MRDEDIKNSIIKELISISESKGLEDREILVHRIAEKYDISDEIVEKHIAEWESGQGIES